MAGNLTPPNRNTSNTRTRIGWLLVGFALGGFFDGILLHQILQWHHLLSGLDDGGDLRFQIMADGLFHLVMYVVAIAGYVLLVAARALVERPGTTTEMLRFGLVGFAAWHVFDALISHWLLGLHRVRMDTDAPLVWDIAWLVVFGLVPLVFAAMMRTRHKNGRGAGAALMSLTALAGLSVAFAPGLGASSETIIVFREGMKPAAMMDAIASADIRLKATDASGTIWITDRVTWSGMATLHTRGALLVSSTPVVAGCLGWTTVPDQQM